jgi:hypothetical protein
MGGQGHPGQAGSDPTVSHGMWGIWPTVRLQSEALSVEVAAEVGARVISLRDRVRDREWLLQGEPPSEAQGRAWSSERAAFGGPESFGWDECLPTVSVCADPLAPAGPPLRDHGDQWGRGSYVSVDEADASVSHTWSAPRWHYRLSRRLSFRSASRLLAEYELQSLADVALPVLWSQHPVFRLEPDSRIELPGVSRVVRTSQAGIDLPVACAWPLATLGDGTSVDLSHVHTRLGWSAKLYAEAPPAPVSAVAPDGARLAIDWDRAFAPALGIWLAYGGWPAGGPPVEQVALEPTTSGHDDLRAAQGDGRARVLEPGARIGWWVSMEPG